MEGVILPGSTIGIFGGGQLGRMTAIAAKRMGYRVIVLDPTPDCPAGQVADDEITAPYTDVTAAKELARQCAVVTAEFENVPADTLEAIEPIVPVRPASRILRIAQNRIAEKTFLAEHGFPVPNFRPVRSREDLLRAVSEIGCPAVLKTATGGYDGKGQVRIEHPDEAEKAWERLGKVDCVLEEFVLLEREVSVIVARNLRGEEAVYPVAENTHSRHILDTSVMPARISPDLAKQAQELAQAIARELELIGLLCVEMFVAQDGRLLVNELAPRPHNSGHQTFDAAVTSQFEQLVRAICNLPLGSTELYRPAAIANLLGDLWEGGEPNWVKALELPDVKLHLYGKAEPRPGRKMGHLTATGETSDEALQKVIAARERLTWR
ncbi:5-(carboxyamino)imidazole ribonucleotide synthase [Fervidibacter sacchari]|uniref:N5-carboxyaminoimidazole ribonucleotide synthase n=1 Tax=Candidatus Fervidibacter sacchari TaxID=1448929 RepID=A0ABT2EUB8_9BACT|nr:5-(carboxyamino)imidazole ribonucleotide synthase [Candidatus Fervidibacter sacchari]MCS3920500.1 5-(carboxyamino)imidazole ribonucleotide synthase [Candidatus Fervidibacter sacchari]WKU14547.1 5-(carboxyamino)imidazole ribonucleotide synthase [Candidatus Fervidibacter sacchari]